MRVILLGYYGFGNAGDEALLLSLLQMLPTSVEPLVLSQRPRQTTATYGVRAGSRNDIRVLRDWFSQAEGFIWGGGSLIQDRSSWRSPLYYLGLMGWAQRLGLITIAWAQGIGPLDRDWIRWLTRRCLAGCTGLSVRDRAAAQLLQGWDIRHAVAPDPVWALESLAPAQWAQHAGPVVAVVLRAHRHLTPLRLNAMAESLSRLQQQTGASLWILPFQLDQGDRATAAALQQRLPGSSQVIELSDPRQLKGVFRRVHLTITMRYHGLVMAAAEGSRCFGLSYDPKVSTLLQALDMPGCDLDQMPADPQALVQLWLDAYQRDPLQADQIQTWHQQAQLHAQVLEQHLTR